jgi:hypothetical protein
MPLIATTDGRHDMGLDQAQQGIECPTDRSHCIRHGRQGDRHPFQSAALGLAVQRLMLAALLEHDHGQEAQAGPSLCHGMDRRQRLADLLAVTAGELLHRSAEAQVYP